MSPSKLLLALITLPATTSYKTSQRLRGAAKQAATPSALKRGAGARLAVNQLDALKEVLATANEEPPQGDISDLLAFSQEAELEQFWLEEAELHEAEDNWAASYDARAEELSQGAILDEDVFELERQAAAGTKGEPDEDVDDGAAYQDDYADILVDEAEDRYKDILDYTDYEYGPSADGEVIEEYAADEEEGAVWHCESDGCHKVADAEAIEIDDDEHKGVEYADADDDEQESAAWRCGIDGCYKVADEAIEQDYYDDDYDSESD